MTTDTKRVRTAISKFPRIPFLAAVVFPVLTLMIAQTGLAQSGKATEQESTGREPVAAENDDAGVRLIVLGIAQDAGFPQAGCERECCRAAWQDDSVRRFVSSVAVVDDQTGERFLFDCTPDFPDQLRLLNQLAPPREGAPPVDGIFLTHAHIGHYTGLMHLGREVMGTNGIPVYTMPRMSEFLSTNGPWSQLVSLENIRLQALVVDQPTRLNDRITVTPFQVPHRDEFSETVGFQINGPEKSAVYLPDIDKWGRWSREVETVIRENDLSFLDGTFFADGEIPGRDMASIPHPFVSESITRFSVLPPEERSGIRFIHLNHTNPLLQPDGDAARRLAEAGMNMAQQQEQHRLDR